MTNYRNYIDEIDEPFSDLEAEIDQDRIEDDHPIWAERDALMFPDLCSCTGDEHCLEHPADDPVTGDAQHEQHHDRAAHVSEWPKTAGFFADQITESASAMRPVPVLCKAVCSTHQRGCALRSSLPYGDEHTVDSHDNTLHLCLATGWGHHFLEETPS